MYNIKKLKKKDYLKTIKLVREISESGFIQKNMNKFLSKDTDFITAISAMYLDFAELLGEEKIQSKIDALLVGNVEGMTTEKLEDLGLDAYIELVLQFAEVQGLVGFLQKAFPALNLENLEMEQA